MKKYMLIMLAALVFAGCEKIEDSQSVVATLPEGTITQMETLTETEATVPEIITQATETEGETAISVGGDVEESETVATTTEDVTTTTEDVTTALAAENDVEITYIDGILIANKTYPLPSDYAPGVDSEAEAAFNEMAAEAYGEGLTLYISSGYRSYDYQAGLYQRYVDRSGKAEADRYSARPGHSEHQTGLAFDLNTISDEFKDTDEGKWVAENCHRFGFIVRYPEGKEDVTGYIYEPWHIRYLGVETATAVYESGLCLEEYLGITSEYEE